MKLNRSVYLTVCMLITFIFQEPIACKGQQKELLLITGTYTTNSSSRGIYVYRFNTLTAQATLADSVITPNPSYLALSPNSQYLYAVNELGGAAGTGKLSAFTLNHTTGKLQFINQQDTHGNHPCYVAIHPSGKWVLAGNYSSGNWSLFETGANGALSPASATVTHAGSGPNSSRQSGPHVHCTRFTPDGKNILTADLGIDQLISYPFSEGIVDTLTKRVTPVTPGGGPRHFTFNQKANRLYLIEELSGNVLAFSFKKNRLKKTQQLPIHSDTTVYPANSADIQLSPDGRFLYTTHRYNNTISAFIVKPNGKLVYKYTQSTLGVGPRNFSITPDGNYLLVANQTSNEIVIFHRNTQSGNITDSGKRISAGKPVCLIWAQLH